MRNLGKDPSSCSTKFLKERLKIIVACNRRNKNKKKQSNCVIMHVRSNWLNKSTRNRDGDLYLSLFCDLCFYLWVVRL